ncbi:hypothetical protein HS088_TW16G00385 [Tripterygium wilfordii]|uniref:NAD(P)-binding Rossmann-fold superfamily protein n=1 Tax=Tripterygium wilfordii TaxID=458696 RepID=A0A7J7CIT2_TRIWF|nr:hypothetical protein HS088_TW16G00385 [Tripterygium wilfordii]
MNGSKRARNPPLFTSPVHQKVVVVGDGGGGDGGEQRDWVCNGEAICRVGIECCFECKGQRERTQGFGFAKKPRTQQPCVSFNEIHENSVENAESVIKTNFYGSKMLTQALLPLFRPSSPISFSSCRILNISSRLGSINELRNPKLKEMLQSEKLTMDEVEGMVGLFLENVKDGTWKTQGWPEIWPDYAVSKMALNGYSRVLAKLYKDKGLCVNCFCPGFTQTSMTGGKGTHTADDAAAVAAGLALIPAKDMQTGRFGVTEVYILGGFAFNMAGLLGFSSLAPTTKNIVVAGGLTAFVFGVYYYTMRAVGGTDELQVAIDKFEGQKGKREDEASLSSKS